jgi:hypothetical protein
VYHHVILHFTHISIAVENYFITHLQDNPCSVFYKIIVFKLQNCWFHRARNCFFNDGRLSGYWTGVWLSSQSCNGQSSLKKLFALGISTHYLLRTDLSFLMLLSWCFHMNCSFLQHDMVYILLFFSQIHTQVNY